MDYLDFIKISSIFFYQYGYAYGKWGEIVWLNNRARWTPLIEHL